VALEGRRIWNLSESCGRGLTRERLEQRERNGERRNCERGGGKRRDRSCEVIVIKGYRF